MENNECHVCGEHTENENHLCSHDCEMIQIYAGV
jgi:predicted nucleic acid-binding Zn ribbon protein